MARRVVFMFAVAAIGVLAFVAIAQSDDPSTEAGLLQSGTHPLVTSIDEQVQDAVGAFADKGLPIDGIPAGAAEEIAKTRPQGANPALSRRAAVLYGRSLYLIPADDAVCLAAIDGFGGSALSCRSVDQLINGTAGPAATFSGCVPRLTGSGPSCDRVTLYGVVPDGVKSVELTFDSRSALATTVQNNVYSFDVALSTGPIAVTYAGPTGKVEQAVPQAG